MFVDAPAAVLHETKEDGGTGIIVLWATDVVAWEDSVDVSCVTVDGLEVLIVLYGRSMSEDPVDELGLDADPVPDMASHGIAANAEYVNVGEDAYVVTCLVRVSSVGVPESLSDQG